MSQKSVAPYSAVIIEFFSDEHLTHCLDSIEKQTHKPEKIVVVINGADEKTVNDLTNRDVHVITPHANLGYSRAANLGISNCETEIVAVLNPDTVLDSECSQYACAVFDDENIGAVGPRILEENGNIYPSARNDPHFIDAIGHAIFGMFKKDNAFTRRYKGLDVDVDVQREADWLSGAAIYLRKSALDDVGGWDEDFFMYCEDIDLGRRLRQASWKQVYVPNAHVIHIQGVSTSRQPISLLWQHHVSLAKYVRKKYPQNLFAQIGIIFFIALRFPLALAAHFLRIN
jgi:N-acetylglucosaminyl-diphospho-decaprenol L-rhamnosyltransferase